MAEAFQESCIEPQHHLGLKGMLLAEADERPLNEDDVPGGRAREENEAENRANENENADVVGLEEGNQWWGIVKEVQMIVIGFITSLFPGFHNID